MKPFRLEPVFRDYLWGGQKLKTKYHKHTDLPVVAESWELSAYPDGTCTIVTGVMKGMLFSQVSEISEIVGTKQTGAFPLLIKLIDAKQDLSIQVHPNDDYARAKGLNNGKTEIWIVLEAESEAVLYCGFKKEISSDEFRYRIDEGTLTGALRKISVKSGDVVFIPAGVVHAIGAGVVIAEIQQSSDATYRVYDYQRRDSSGNLRQLHIEDALNVATRKPTNPSPPGARLLIDEEHIKAERLVECHYFTVDRIAFQHQYFLKQSRETFISLVVIEGELALYFQEDEFRLLTGDSLFIPAGTEVCTLEGRASILLTHI